jgi:hypothetical protein
MLSIVFGALHLQELLLLLLSLESHFDVVHVVQGDTGQ